MLYLLAPYLEQIWGPFRLFKSHAFLLAIGTLLSAFLVMNYLPKLWGKGPQDQGKAILGVEGMVSKGKPTGMGLWVTLLILPVILLVMPLTVSELGVLLFLYMAMVFGYLDDRSMVPWGQLKKGLLDVAVSLGVALFVWTGHGGEVWVPFVKGVWTIPWWIYIPCAGFLLFIVMNATNCSDGVDGLAGSLTLIALVSLSALLYLVIGYAPVAKYLLVPNNPFAARWAVLLMTVGGGFAGYLWWNAEPSRVLMGDAGSRFLGLLLGAGVLVTGNPFLILAFAPVLLVNGGGGLVKLVLLRFFRKLGWEVRPAEQLEPEEERKKNLMVKALQKVRFPLHDHCKKQLRWSNAQVLMRFMLIQAFLMPIIFLLLVKIR